MRLIRRQMDIGGLTESEGFINVEDGDWFDDST
jgi:hypothetical protein